MKKRSKVWLALLIAVLLIALATATSGVSADSILVTADSLNEDGDFRWSNVDLGPCMGEQAFNWVNTAGSAASCLAGGGQGWTFKGLWREGYGYYHGFGEDAEPCACVKAVCLSPPPPVEYTDTDYVYYPRPTPGP